MKINDYEIYTSRMRKTVFDKCWWSDKIDDEVDTVVDFGCATGDLFSYLRDIEPDRFKMFIGIENDLTMRHSAESEHSDHKDDTFFVPSIKCLVSIPNFDASRAVFVMNSVIHEILTYEHESFYNIMDMVSRLGFKYIAIRDMYFNGVNVDDGTKAKNAENGELEVVLTAVAEDKLSAHENDAIRERWIEHKWNSPLKGSKLVTEFLLKYRYEENWDREKNETYLWDWPRMTVGITHSYSTIFTDFFSMPWQKEKIKKDLGINWPFTTHLKVLFGRKEN